jgi:hypothetical protein
VTGGARCPLCAVRVARQGRDPRLLPDERAVAAAQQGRQEESLGGRQRPGARCCDRSPVGSSSRAIAPLPIFKTTGLRVDPVVLRRSGGASGELRMPRPCRTGSHDGSVASLERAGDTARLRQPEGRRCTNATLVERRRGSSGPQGGSSVSASRRQRFARAETRSDSYRCARHPRGGVHRRLRPVTSCPAFSRLDGDVREVLRAQGWA